MVAEAFQAITTGGLYRGNTDPKHAPQSPLTRFKECSFNHCSEETPTNLYRGHPLLTKPSPFPAGIRDPLKWKIYAVLK